MQTANKIKIAPSNLDKLASMLSVASETVAMIQRHESLGQVNVHSHGLIIGDVVELMRRAHALAEAFQVEVQGR